jgi:MYXO-CTERM domain-containing protein
MASEARRFAVAFAFVVGSAALFVVAGCQPEGAVDAPPAGEVTVQESVRPLGSLRANYAAHAEHVLGAAGRVLRETSGGFALDSHGRAEANAMRLELPRDGRDPIVFRHDEGTEPIRVAELGVRGPASQDGNAVSYERDGGRVYWAHSPGGFEEWLDLDAGRAFAGREVARWRVEGAVMREHGSTIVVQDADATPRMLVRAPIAWAASGREVPTHLRLDGPDLVLEVDAEGEAVLVDPTWTAVASFTARNDHTLTLLSDGRVLAAGGRNGLGSTVVSTTQVYDPAADTWTAGGSLTAARRLHTATLLPDGRVLIAGGVNTGGSLATAEIYDPATNTCTATAPLASAAQWRTATRLTDGRVLVAGGENGSTALNTAQIFDPATSTWAAATTMTAARRQHAATLLADGRVLVAGGVGSGAPPPIHASAEVFDPATDTWTATGAMTVASHVRAALITLADGRALSIGGTSTAAEDGPPTAVTELYDPVANTWAATGSLTVARTYTEAFRLVDGGVLIVAGNIGTGAAATAVRTTEIYDPATATWRAGVSLTTARSGAMNYGVRLSDGRILVAGGTNGPLGLSGATPTVEIYASDANGVACVSNSDCVSGFCTDGVCCATACAGGTGDCQACSIAAGAAADGTCGTVAEATTCSDGNSCTAADSCSAGTCVAGGDPCFSGTACTPSGGSFTCGACPSGTFSDDGTGSTACVAWTSCAAGEFVSSAGSPTSDRECDACAAGTFSTTTNASACSSWTSCDAGTFVATAGSATSDRACDACAAGTFSTTTNASACSAWSTCGAGSFIAADGSATSDRECDACAAGTFSTTTNASACSSWMSCGAGSFVATAGSATSDRACEACPAGTFTDAANESACTAWTVCDADEYQASEGSASSDRECTACTICDPGETEITACSATADTVCSESDAGTTADAGVDAGAEARDGGLGDAGDGGTGGVDGGSGPSGGGCDCDATGSRGALPTALLGMALFGLVITRRRRR